MPEPIVDGLVGGGGRASGHQVVAVRCASLSDLSHQENRWWFHVISNSVGRASETGLSPPEKLQRFRQRSTCEEVHEVLPEINAEAIGCSRIRARTEPRRFVVSPQARPDLAAASMHFLTAEGKDRREAPFGVSVMSYAIGEVLAAVSHTQHDRRLARLTRQILVLHTDVICLQGLPSPNSGSVQECFSRSLVATMSAKGYSCVATSGPAGEGNAILWDRSRMQFLSTTEQGSALCVDFQSVAGSACQIRVACLSPEVPTFGSESLSDLFCSGPSVEPPIIICSDLTRIGGAHCASVIEELSVVRSAMWEMLGEEVMTPMQASQRVNGVLISAPARSAASGLNRLHCPDAVHFRGLSPVLALSGHTEGYLGHDGAKESSSTFSRLSYAPGRGVRLGDEQQQRLVTRARITII